MAHQLENWQIHDAPYKEADHLWAMDLGREQNVSAPVLFESWIQHRDCLKCVIVLILDQWFGYLAFQCLNKLRFAIYVQYVQLSDFRISTQRTTSLPIRTLSPLNTVGGTLKGSQKSLKTFMSQALNWCSVSREEPIWEFHLVAFPTFRGLWPSCSSVACIPLPTWDTMDDTLTRL